MNCLSANNGSELIFLPSFVGISKFFYIATISAQREWHCFFCNETMRKKMVPIAKKCLLSDTPIYDKTITTYCLGKHNILISLNLLFSG
jgi:hypothetical protein